MYLKKSRELFKKLVDNSVGNEKKCQNNRIIKKVILNLSLDALIMAFAVTSLTGCGDAIRKESPKITDTSKDDYSYSAMTPSFKEEFDEMIEKDNFNGYTTYEIRTYETLRAKEILNNNDLTEYGSFITENGFKRKYNYKAEDYEKISELDETYLYGMYMVTHQETLNEILKSLGYENLDDFLLKNNYTDVNGNPSIKVWQSMDLVQMSEIMAQMTRK